MSGMRHDWWSPAGVIAPLKREEDGAVLAATLRRISS